MYPKGHSPEDLRAHFEKKHGKPLEDVDHETLRKSFLAHVDEHPDAAEGMMDLHGDMAGWKRPTMKKPGMKESLNLKTADGLMKGFQAHVKMCFDERPAYGLKNIIRDIYKEADTQGLVGPELAKLKQLVADMQKKYDAMKEGVNTMFPKLSLFTSLIEDGVPSEYQKQVPRGHENTARIKCPWCGDSSKKAFEWENNNGKCAKCHKSLYKPGQRPLAQEALLPEEKEEAVPMGKKEVLAALKDMTPADRKAVHTKLMAMVEADEAEAE
jgi:hypothetical protein